MQLLHKYVLQDCNVEAFINTPVSITRSKSNIKCYVEIRFIVCLDIIRIKKCIIVISNKIVYILKYVRFEFLCSSLKIYPKYNNLKESRKWWEVWGGG